jgi:uncharacterized protein (UPF0333 family)
MNFLKKTLSSQRGAAILECALITGMVLIVALAGAHVLTP